LRPESWFGIPLSSDQSKRGCGHPHCVSHSYPQRDASARGPRLPDATQIAQSCGTPGARFGAWPTTSDRTKLLGRTGVCAINTHTSSRNQRRRAADWTQMTMTQASSQHPPPADRRAVGARSLAATALHLWYSVPDSVHCSRASDLPRPGLARDPTGVALAAPIPHGPRAGR
jgi:hypothetical protein